jgi:putative transposase
MDMYSRRIVGWQVWTRLHTTLALDALEMGLWNRDRVRRTEDSRSATGDLIHHSDRGVQYRAVRYTEHLEDAQVVASVGSKGRFLR